MKPFRILLFFLSVFLILFTVALYFPEKGIKLPGNIVLKFYTAKDFFEVKDSSVVNIQEILKNQALLNDSVIAVIVNKKANPAVNADSIGLMINADSLKKSIIQIEYPNNDSTILFPLFRALKELPKSGQLIRIMHYGDSQIEDDRITSLLRYHLQNKFGGSGVGLIPASHLYPFAFSITQESSDNWERNLVYAKNNNQIPHKRYGALASFCTLKADPSIEDTINPVGWIKFSKSPYSYSNTRHFKQCRIFCGYNTEPFVNEVYTGNELYNAEIIPPTNKLKVIKWLFNKPVSDLLIQFKGTSGPEVYGISLDNTAGVAVDNIPLRGCAGLIFTSIDQQLLREMYKELNVKLFILQFGGNVVPYIAEKYTNYEKWYCSQIERLKELCPVAAVLVVGVADMSVKEKDKFVPYPNLGNINNAVKNAAFKAGAAYWDLQKAMGGKNSMPAWVNANPPLATTDYVHFTPRGSKLIAQMFYNAIIYEYLQYEKITK
jgi:lysophospholipase L1-like esterase